MIGQFPPPREEEPLTYSLELGENGDYTVRCGDRYEQYLCADEALWLIARILMTDGDVRLRTKAQHDVEHARAYGPASILEPWQKLICGHIKDQCDRCEASTDDLHLVQSHGYDFVCFSCRESLYDDPSPVVVL